MLGNKIGCQLYEQQVFPLRDTQFVGSTGLHVPPTLAERTKDLFDVVGTPNERYAKAKQVVQSVNQNLLIVFANPTDSRVGTLMQIRSEDQDFRSFQDDFRFMANRQCEKDYVWVKMDRRWTGALEIMKELREGQTVVYHGL